MLYGCAASATFALEFPDAAVAGGAESYMIIGVPIFLGVGVGQWLAPMYLRLRASREDEAIDVQAL